MNFKSIKHNILERLNIVDVIGHYLKLEKKGNNYWAICPFHHDTKPSLSVSDKLQIYRCFTCNHSGNLIHFVQTYKNLNFKSTVKELITEFNLDNNLLDQFNELSPQELEKIRICQLNDLASFWYEQFLYNIENKKAYEYLIQRGLNEELIKQFRIGYAPFKKDVIYKLASNENNIRNLDSNSDDVFSVDEILASQLVKINDEGQFYDFFYDRIIFSIKDEDDQIIGFSARALEKNVEPKYINTPTNLVFKKDTVLYNIDQLAKNQQTTCVYVVEGFMDVIALNKVGINNTVATMGVNFSLHHFEKIKSILAKLDTLILAFDNDTPGLEAKLKIGKNIAQFCNVFVLNVWQDSAKDLDELVQTVSQEKVLTTLNDTVDFFMFYLDKHYLNHPHLNNLAYKQQILKEILADIYVLGNIFFINSYQEWIKKYLNIDYRLNSDLFKKNSFASNKSKSTLQEVNQAQHPKKKRKSIWEEINDSLKYLYFRIFIWMFYNRRYLKLSMNYNLIDFDLYTFNLETQTLFRDNFYNRIYHLILTFYENYSHENSIFFANKNIVDHFVERSISDLGLKKFFYTLMSYAYEFLINTETEEYQRADFINLIKVIELKKIDLELLPLLKIYEKNKADVKLRQKIIEIKKRKNAIYKKY